jgi:predicted dehydrogenase
MHAKTKIGIVGSGRMGALHLSKFSSLPTVELVGFYEPNPERAAEISNKLSIKAFSTLEELVFNIDGLVIASPTSTHFSIAKMALSQGCHVLIEKPFCETVDEANELDVLAQEKQLICQVGFLERFRFESLMGHQTVPKTAKIHATRFSTVVGREESVDVVSDLMIHDLDLVLSIAQEEPTKISAVGFPVVTNYLDFATATLEFASGMIAELSASRVSSVQKRGFQIVSPGYSCELDFVANTKFSVARLGGGKHFMSPTSFDALTLQSLNFIEAIQGKAPAKIVAGDGKRVIAVVEKIRTTILGDHRNLIKPIVQESSLPIREH